MHFYWLFIAIATHLGEVKSLNCVAIASQIITSQGDRYLLAMKVRSL
ncbi:hypothetical protein [Pseudanabaena minima]